MREHFLLDPDTVFLNHGSFGATPAPVLAAQQQWQREMERNPVQFLGRRSADLLASARARLAAYLGARSEDLVFVPNATTGVNTVARSLALQPGDEILTTDHEYGACDATWEFVCRHTGAQVRRVPVPLPFEPQAWAPRLLAAVGPRTRLIFTSHVTSTTALVFDVAALCAGARALGVRTLIDGAHAPGLVPLHLQSLGADFYTGNCHKWMCAPKGSGFLHVQPEHQPDIDAPVVSWGYVADSAGHTGFDAYTGHTVLERRLQWQGTRDLAAFLSVPAAMDFQAQYGWPQHSARCRDMALATLQTACAHSGLAALAPDAAYTQMVPIPVRTRDAEGLRRQLFDEHRIEVPVTQHGEHTFVRVSVQAYNTQAELDKLLDVLAALKG